MFQVKGKVALITGAARGIGLCLARELLRNEVKGVALLDIDETNGKIAVQKLTQEYDQERVIYLNTDVTNRTQFEEAFEKTIATFNQLDIVVNNAGIFQELQWEKCIAVNFQGCVTGSLLALDKYFPNCLGSGEGVILNMSSVMALAKFQEMPVYSGTKAGLLAFSRCLSGPLRSHHLNVKILTVCPGFTRTKLLIVTSEQSHEELILSATEKLKALGTQTALQLATHVVEIIKDGETGSVWKVDNNIRNEVDYPTLFNYDPAN